MNFAEQMATEIAAYVDDALVNRRATDLAGAAYASASLNWCLACFGYGIRFGQHCVVGTECGHGRPLTREFWAKPKETK